MVPIDTNYEAAELNEGDGGGDVGGDDKGAPYHVKEVLVGTMVLICCFRQQNYISISPLIC
jgi:hypothetical protein